MMLPKKTCLQPLIQLNHEYICYENVPLHKSFGFMLLIGIHSGRSCMFSFLEVKWIDLWSLWSRTTTYTMEFMEVNTIKIRFYSLEVVGWILKDIKLICEQFVSNYFYLFIYLFLLRCNCVALALISVATCSASWTVEQEMRLPKAPSKKKAPKF